MFSIAHEEGSAAHNQWWAANNKGYQCPYEEGTTEYEDWYDGWGDAADCLALPAI